MGLPWRKGLGTLVCLLPVALVVGSLGWGIAGADTPPWSGAWLAGLAVVHAAFNVHIVLRPYVHQRRHGSMEGFRSASVLPLGGSILVVCSTIVGFGAVGTACVCALALAADFGGLPWFLASTWDEHSMWEPPAR